MEILQGGCYSRKKQVQELDKKCCFFLDKCLLFIVLNSYEWVFHILVGKGRMEFSSHKILVNKNWDLKGIISIFGI